MKSP
ncbi:hypothetical protein E2C01_060983 [Portunus trituberculatus]|jgi:hypothetical protein